MLISEDPVEQAGYLLMSHAGVEVWPDAEIEQRRLLRRARSAVHPDRVGNRTLWDQVEEAAQLLGLSGKGTDR